MENQNNKQHLTNALWNIIKNDFSAEQIEGFFKVEENFNVMSSIDTMKKLTNRIADMYISNNISSVQLENLFLKFTETQ